MESSTNSLQGVQNTLIGVVCHACDVVCHVCPTFAGQTLQTSPLDSHLRLCFLCLLSVCRCILCKMTTLIIQACSHWPNYWSLLIFSLLASQLIYGFFILASPQNLIFLFNYS